MQQQQLLAMPSCAAVAAALETLQVLKWGGRSVGSHTSSFEPARTLVASLQAWWAQAQLLAQPRVGIHWHSQKHAASSTVEVHTSPSRSRGVSATIAYSSTARAHCESTLQRDGTLRLETAALCCRHCAPTASERDPKLPGPLQHKTARPLALAAGTPARRSARRSRTATGLWRRRASDKGDAIVACGSRAAAAS